MKLDLPSATSSEITAYTHALFYEQITESQTFESAATHIVQSLYETFRQPDGTPLFALLRVFRFGRYEDLSDELRESADPAINHWLSLVGTVGIEPEWCDRRTSREHRVIPADTYATPMLRAAFEQIGLPIGSELLTRKMTIKYATGPGETAFFFVPDAVDNDDVPAQDFVAEYGIRSVIGVGARLLNDTSCICIGFARQTLTQPDAEKFSSISPFLMTILSKYNTPGNLWNAPMPIASGVLAS